MIKATPEQLRTITAILARLAPGLEVRAFGSRAGGNAKPFSDLDLVIMAPRPLAPSILGDIRDAFDASDLPFRVEIQDWNAISDAFKKVIEKRCEVLPTA